MSRISSNYIVVTLYYDPEYNFFCDDQGLPIYEIFTMIRHIDLLLFKRNKCKKLVYNPDVDVVYELEYMDAELE